jgi:hypothetical protein
LEWQKWEIGQQLQFRKSNEGKSFSGVLSFKEREGWMALHEVEEPLR